MEIVLQRGRCSAHSPRSTNGGPRAAATQSGKPRWSRAARPPGRTGPPPHVRARAQARARACAACGPERGGARDPRPRAPARRRAAALNLPTVVAAGLAGQHEGVRVPSAQGQELERDERRPSDKATMWSFVARAPASRGAGATSTAAASGAKRTRRGPEGFARHCDALLTRRRPISSAAHVRARAPPTCPSTVAHATRPLARAGPPTDVRAPPAHARRPRARARWRAGPPTHARAPPANPRARRPRARAQSRARWSVEAPLGARVPPRCRTSGARTARIRVLGAWGACRPPARGRWWGRPRPGGARRRPTATPQSRGRGAGSPTWRRRARPH